MTGTLMHATHMFTKNSPYNFGNSIGGFLRTPCAAQLLHACDVNTAVFLSLHDIVEH